MMLALELAEVGRHVVLIEGVDLRLRGGVLVGHGPVGDAAYTMVMCRLRWPSIAAIASSCMPRLMAWVARVCRSWCG